jgi:hypothetical protein
MFVWGDETVCCLTIYSWFISQVSCQCVCCSLFCLMVSQVLGVIVANDVVDAIKCRGNTSLYVHTILRRDHKDPKSPLEDSDNPLDNVSKLHMM